jgi:hypothetical protein
MIVRASAVLPVWRRDDQLRWPRPIGTSPIALSPVCRLADRLAVDDARRDPFRG